MPGNEPTLKGWLVCSFIKNLNSATANISRGDNTEGLIINHLRKVRLRAAVAQRKTMADAFAALLTSLVSI